MSEPQTITFAGEKFAVADRIGLMPLMRFAHIAQSGVDSEDMAGLAALYDLLEQCFPDEEWERFQRAATKARADGEELMGVIKAVFEVLSERPTPRPSDSSDGPQVIPESSEVASYSQVVAREEQRGRPDRALMVLMAEEARSAV